MCVCIFLEGSEEWVHVRIRVCLLIGRTKKKGFLPIMLLNVDN